MLEKTRLASNERGATNTRFTARLRLAQLALTSQFVNRGNDRRHDDRIFVLTLFLRGDIEKGLRS
jgi:hypothetical protein